jgi:hypothetical protein
MQQFAPWFSVVWSWKYIWGCSDVLASVYLFSIVIVIVIVISYVFLSCLTRLLFFPFCLYVHFLY